MSVAVIGGGVAGLWTAWRLLRDGHSVALIERDALGSGQTVASQGIIHGGIKYTLGGEATSAARMVAQMPAVWRRAMTDPGEHEPDLRSARVLSAAQYLWSGGSLFSRLTAGVAAAAIRADVERILPASACAGLAGAGPGVAVHRVDEVVIDPRSVVLGLVEAVRRRGGALIKGEPRRQGAGVLQIGGGTVRFSTLVLTAGAGNEALLAGEGPRMQRRPLHMVMARGELPEVYGHCLAAMSDKPRLTITMQRDGAGRGVWYIGGLIAEEGVGRGREEQIARARAEVASCLPWVDVSGAEWATVRVDRAEGLTDGGSRPDGPVVGVAGPGASRGRGPGVVCAWPTKLVFAPLVAERISELVGPPVGAAAPVGALHRAAWPEPGVALQPWDAPGVAWS